MTFLEHQIQTLASKMRLDEQSAQYLPQAVNSLGKQLKATPEEVINLTRLTPQLLQVLAQDCRRLSV